MNLNAPKKATWIFGLILFVVALVVKFAVPTAGDAGFWIAIADACLMICATYFSGL